MDCAVFVWNDWHRYFPLGRTSVVSRLILIRRTCDSGLFLCLRRLNCLKIMGHLASATQSTNAYWHYRIVNSEVMSDARVPFAVAASRSFVLTNDETTTPR